MTGVKYTSEILHESEQNSRIGKAFKDYGKKLLGFIRKRVNSDAEAEDILQDVWLKFTAVVHEAPIEETSAWLYQVARNRIVDRYRKKSETRLEEEAPEEDEERFLLHEIMSAPGDSPENEYLRSLFWEELFKALNELPEAQRQVFTWHELEDRPFEEIAAQTGENLNTLISRKRYAVIHLRKRLKQLYYEIIDY